MDQVNKFKNQLYELNKEKKSNEQDIKKLKSENSGMEVTIGKVRTKNEKLARAIRNVKDNPNVLTQVREMVENG